MTLPSSSSAQPGGDQEATGTSREVKNDIAASLRATTCDTAKRGRFIVFEGIDRSGKTTQSRLLTERLESEGRKVKSLRFPDRASPTGVLLNNHLQKKYSTRPEVLHLLFSANRWEKNDEIEGWMKAGYDVVADRYAFSGAAYSSGALGLDWQWCLKPDRGLVAPDAVFFLSLAPPDAQKRNHFGTEYYENHEMQERIAEAYLKFSKLPYWRVISANQPAEEVHREIYDAVSSTLLLEGLPLPSRLFEAATMPSLCLTEKRN